MGIEFSASFNNFQKEVRTLFYITEVTSKVRLMITFTKLDRWQHLQSHSDIYTYKATLISSLTKVL